MKADALLYPLPPFSASKFCKVLTYATSEIPANFPFFTAYRK